MNEILFPELMRSFIGADRLRTLNERVSTSNYTSNFPPHNIEQIGENKYVLTFALAGYKPEDLNISVHKDVLTIESVQREEKEEKVYLHRAISFRHFTKKLVLGEYIQVSSAGMENGLLSISLERIVPEEAKPKQISISVQKQFEPYNPTSVADDYFFSKDSDLKKKEPLKVVNK